MLAVKRGIFIRRRAVLFTTTPTNISIPQDHRDGRSFGDPVVIASPFNLMLTIFLGLALGLAIGGGCRWFDIPSPSPPRIVGALLVLAMTLGYLATDYVLPKKPEVTQASPTAKAEP
jgi:XapX domain-containing protein